MNLELLKYIGCWVFIIVFAFQIRRISRGSKMTSFLFLDKGGPFVYRIYDIAKKWRGIPLQFPALGWIEPEEEKEKNRGWGWNEFFEFLIIIVPILIIFIGLGISSSRAV